MARKKKTGSKADNFTRLAVVRMDRTIKTLNTLGTLGGVNYESTPAQRKKMKEALTAAVDDVFTRLEGGHGSGFAF